MSSALVHDAMNAPQMPRAQPVAIPRSQVGIERLPTRRLSNEPRESMNCKSCRKRKIKCNRLRPACEACQVFQCPCVYDAVPKKRGPKTDVLEALLKRVDGLEAKLKEKNTEDGEPTSPPPGDSSAIKDETDEADPEERAAKRLASDVNKSPTDGETAAFSQPASATRRDSEARQYTQSQTVEPAFRGPPSPVVPTEALLDTYFSRFHAKPHHILDESSVRQRLQLKQLPDYLRHAIWAVAARYTPHPHGYQAAVKLSEDYAARSRREIDTDEPSTDGLQTLLLLVISFVAAGKGKRAYMLMTSAIGMAMALELHRELDMHARVTPVERELRRRLFWTCYLIDRYLVCGSKRPSLIGDKTIVLRLPSWPPDASSLPMDGEFFQCGSNLQYFQGSGKKSQGSSGMLIDITRILGETNRYLAAGGVKGDSHFPWHSLSNLSKIRQDLDTWASGTNNVFSSLDVLFGQADSTVLVLSKLIYHLIHCLIYRPFLPIDLAELAGNGQHQSWQIEATNMCFLHANAIAELIRLGRHAGTIEWPAFVGYCICTAGTVHIHGAHYSKQGANGEANVFSSSAEFLSREMQQLSELTYAWASVQHQRETLQGIYSAHGELVKTLTSPGTRYTPGFHLEDFFDRYANIGNSPGGRSYHFDAANLSLSDVVVDFTADSYPGYELHAPRMADGSTPPNLKRKNTGPSNWKRPDPKILARLDPQTAGLANPARGRRSMSHLTNMAQHPSPGLFTTPMPQHMENPELMLQMNPGHGQGEDNAANSAAVAAAAAAGFGLSPTAQNNSGQGVIGGLPFTPPYSYTSGPGNSNTIMSDANGYDPMFGTLPTNAFSSPTAWQGDESGNLHAKMNQAPAAGNVTSPGNKSNNGSTGTGHSEEKDPFLSLLEQLAENEQRFNNGMGNELDFFLAGTGSGAS